MNESITEEKPKPSYHALQWHLTHKCNLRCAHCYQKDYSVQTEEAEMIPVLDKYERFLKRGNYYGHIFLTGGEPLCHSSFFDLCNEISKRGFLLTVMTNGTLVGQKEANRMLFSGVHCVQVSLDGTRKIHDRIRGRGSFDAALDGIDHLKNNGLDVIVSFTAQKSNLRCFPELARICSEHNVDKLWWDRVVTDNEKDTRSLALTTKQFGRFVHTAGKLSEEYKNEKGNSLVSMERALQFLGCSDGGCGYKCRAGGSMLTLLADGSVMPCRRLPFVIGNIRDGEFDDIIAKSDLMKELKNSALPEECEACAHKDKCSGGAKCVTYGQTGMLYSRDVNCFNKL